MTRFILSALLVLGLAAPSFDSKKKEAEAWDMQAFGTNINSAVDAKGQPGQAKAMAERYKLLAAGSTVTSVETDAVAADLFARLAGDKIKEQK